MSTGPGATLTICGIFGPPRTAWHWFLGLHWLLVPGSHSPGSCAHRRPSHPVRVCVFIQSRVWKRDKPTETAMLTFLGLALSISLLANFLRVAGDCSVRPFLTSLGNCIAQPHGSINTTADSWGIRVFVGDQELCISPSTGGRLFEAN